LGQTSAGKIITVVVIFLLVCVFIYGKPETVRSIKKRSLDQALVTVDGWRAGPHVPYDKAVVESLELDDYLNKTFIKDGASVSLYIGYYLTGGKVGAAHDPLVCFPGQGWTVSGRQTGTVQVDLGPDLNVPFSSMLVGKENENNQMILYWFQSYETANANTFLQKLSVLLQKFAGVREDNAFVRLTCSTSKKSEAECLETMKDFTKSFYPIFLEYIRE